MDLTDSLQVKLNWNKIFGLLSCTAEAGHCIFAVNSWCVNMSAMSAPGRACWHRWSRLATMDVRAGLPAGTDEATVTGHWDWVYIVIFDVLFERCYVDWCCSVDYRLCLSPTRKAPARTGLWHWFTAKGKSEIHARYPHHCALHGAVEKKSLLGSSHCAKRVTESRLAWLELLIVSCWRNILILCFSSFVFVSLFLLVVFCFFVSDS